MYLLVSKSGFSLPVCKYRSTVWRATPHCSAICSGVYTVPVCSFIRFLSGGTDGVAFARALGARFQIPPGQPFGADDIHVGLPLPEDRAQFGQDGIGLADDAQHVVCRRVRMQGRVS
jgi:hypothetical protein